MRCGSEQHGLKVLGRVTYRHRGLSAYKDHAYGLLLQLCGSFEERIQVRYSFRLMQGSSTKQYGSSTSLLYPKVHTESTLQHNIEGAFQDRSIILRHAEQAAIGLVWPGVSIVWPDMLLGVPTEILSPSLVVQCVNDDVPIVIRCQSACSLQTIGSDFDGTLVENLSNSNGNVDAAFQR